MASFMNKTNLIKIILAVMLTVFLVGFLLSQLNGKEIIKLLFGIPFFFFLLSFLFYFLLYIFKAIRFKLLLRDKFSTKNLFSVVSVHNMFANILPFRTGELSYIYLLKKKGVQSTEAISSLIIARVADFLTILVLTFLTLLITRDVSKIYWVLCLSLAVATIFFFILLLMTIKFKKKILPCLKGAVNLFHLRQNRLASFLLETTQETILNLKGTQKKTFIKVIFVSILAFFSQFLFCYTLLTGMGIKIGFLYVILGSMFADLAIFFPIQGIMGFGTMEGIWAIGFFYLGVPKELAISSGFVQHFVSIAFFIVFGLYGLITLKTVRQLPPS